MIDIFIKKQKHSFESGTTFGQIATHLGLKGVIGARIQNLDATPKDNGADTVDLHTAATSNIEVDFFDASSEHSLEIIRHSTAHLLAMAVQNLRPEIKVTIGPVIENGFFYDFHVTSGDPLTEKDLPIIENEMRKILKKRPQIARKVVSLDQAVELFSKMGEKYKVEIVEALPPSEPISLYHLGPWFDLCRGPHVNTSSQLGAFKLTSIAGAYWRGDSNNPMLTRIYGTAWRTKEELEAYLHQVEEAKKRDHKILGKALNLFSLHPEAVAQPFFHPNGTTILRILQNLLLKSNAKYQFEQVYTPLIMDEALWKKSGHYDHYAENMYFTEIDGRTSAVKPMNCPGHALIYKSRKRSYKELPVRLAEFGRVHRHELSGACNGILRVRSFVQDDAHIFCQASSIESEIKKVIEQIDEIYQVFGFTYKIEISTRPDSSVGSDEVWELSERTLVQVVESLGIPYKINPGDGAFYGPKIDFHLKDSIGRVWQCGTIQLDFSMPERFELDYVSEANSNDRPVMIHRVVIGSLERFFGVLIEHTAGLFPLWLAPIQVQLVTVSNSQDDLALTLLADLKAAGIRCEADIRNEKLGYKIRHAQMLKIPYMIVIGAEEAKNNTVSPRKRDGTQLEALGIKEFIASLKEEMGPYADLL